MAPGDASDDFHTCQSTTTVAAVDKLREVLAHLPLYSDDAGKFGSLPFAGGGKPDRCEQADLTYSLSAEHGEEVPYQTCKDRGRFSNENKITNPAQPVEVHRSLCLNPTNVHVMWLMQETLFVEVLGPFRKRKTNPSCAAQSLLLRCTQE